MTDKQTTEAGKDTSLDLPPILRRIALNSPGLDNADRWDITCAANEIERLRKIIRDVDIACNGTGRGDISRYQRTMNDVRQATSKMESATP